MVPLPYQSLLDLFVSIVSRATNINKSLEDTSCKSRDCRNDGDEERKQGNEFVSCEQWKKCKFARFNYCDMSLTFCKRSLQFSETCPRNFATFCDTSLSYCDLYDCRKIAKTRRKILRHVTVCLSLFAVQVEKSKAKRNATKSGTVSLLSPWPGRPCLSNTSVISKVVKSNKTVLVSFLE